MDNNRISISSLGAAISAEPVYLQAGAATIEVKPRIPYAEVLDMVQFCIDWTINDRPFVSEPLKKIVHDYAILRFYTNLDTSIFEESPDLKDIYSQYDILVSYEVVDKVTNLIDAAQLRFFEDTVEKTLESIAAYRNSAQGIIDAVNDSAKDIGDNIGDAMSLVEDDARMEKINTLLKFAEQIKG